MTPSISHEHRSSIRVGGIDVHVINLFAEKEDSLMINSIDLSCGCEHV